MVEREMDICEGILICEHSVRSQKGNLVYFIVFLRLSSIQFIYFSTMKCNLQKQSLPFIQWHHVILLSEYIWGIGLDL